MIIVWCIYINGNARKSSNNNDGDDGNEHYRINFTL